MSTVMLWSLLILAIFGFLLFDQHLARLHYGFNRSRGAGNRRFLRWWAKQCRVKFTVSGCLIVVVSLALYFQDHTLLLPDVRVPVTVPKITQVSSFLLLAGVGFLLLDLATARRFYQGGGGLTAFEIPFFRWWLKRNGKKLAVAGVVGCLTLCASWATLRFDLLQPKTATSRYMVSAQRYFDEKNYRASIIELRNAISRNRDDNEAYLWLARAYGRLGRLTEAGDAYREVIRITPKLYEAHLELGRLELLMGESAAAQREAELALALAPLEPEARQLLAGIALGKGSWQPAVAQYRAVLAGAPGNREVRNLLISLLMGRRDYISAEREAQAGLKQDHRDMELLIALSRAQEAMGHRGEALATLGEAERDTVSPLPFIARGALLFRAGEYVPAMQSYEAALKKAPDNVAAMNNLALLITDHGFDQARAAVLASRLYAKYPREPAVMDTMGWALLRQGRRDSALWLLKQAASGTPNNPAYRYHYGAALFRTGQKAAGRRELEAALRLSTDFDGVEAVRTLLKSKG